MYSINIYISYCAREIRNKKGENKTAGNIVHKMIVVGEKMGTQYGPECLV